MSNLPPHPETEEARAKAEAAMARLKEKTRCPTCGRLFKCVEAHHVVKHRSFIPLRK